MKLILGIIILAVIVALIIVVPVATIWALNILFALLAIPYTLKTYFAILLLISIIGGSSIASK